MLPQATVWCEVLLGLGIQRKLNVVERALDGVEPVGDVPGDERGKANSDSTAEGAHHEAPACSLVDRINIDTHNELKLECAEVHDGAVDEQQ